MSSARLPCTRSKSVEESLLTTGVHNTFRVYRILDLLHQIHRSLSQLLLHISLKRNDQGVRRDGDHKVQPGRTFLPTPTPCSPVHVPSNAIALSTIRCAAASTLSKSLSRKTRPPDIRNAGISNAWSLRKRSSSLTMEVAVANVSDSRFR